MNKPRLKRGLFLLVLGFASVLLPVFIVTEMKIGLTEAQLREVWQEAWLGYRLIVSAGFLLAFSGLYMLISGLIRRGC